MDRRAVCCVWAALHASSVSEPSPGKHKHWLRVCESKQRVSATALHGTGGREDHAPSPPVLCRRKVFFFDKVAKWPHKEALASPRLLPVGVARVVHDELAVAKGIRAERRARRLRPREGLVHLLAAGRARHDVCNGAERSGTDKRHTCVCCFGPGRGEGRGGEERPGERSLAFLASLAVQDGDKKGKHIRFLVCTISSCLRSGAHTPHAWYANRRRAGERGAARMGAYGAQMVALGALSDCCAIPL